jgi:hypothetical protein
MKKKKKIESIDRFMKRRSHETGKVTVPNTKVHPDEAGGSHKQMARMTMTGVTKPETIKQLHAYQKKRKKRARETPAL